VQLHKDIPDLKLANVDRANCLHELEFYFPLALVTPDIVRKIFCPKDVSGSPVADQGLMAQHLAGLDFGPVRGFMRGFIDMVFEFQGKFYLVDWKSNYLGSRSANYCQAQLAETILSGMYFMQYHIYCLALHLYLEKRLPGYRYEDHFGGAFYVFLRGVNPRLGPDYGIYHDLPAPAAIQRLNTQFIAG
jgi:exodeoxyribonuclease V beta subunit